MVLFTIPIAILGEEYLGHNHQLLLADLGLISCQEVSEKIFFLV